MFSIMDGTTLLLLFGTVSVVITPIWSSAARLGVPGEVERKEECEPHHFHCADGSRCIPESWRCDTRVHCPDASDELDCKWNRTCGIGQFQCAKSGICIAANWRCDGDDDCGPHDNSDEDPYTCEKDFKCPPNEARCATPTGGTFTCVPIERFCDDTRDCPDNSDEWDICDNFTKSSCAALNCSVGCKNTFAGLECYCPHGYYHNNGKCVDVNECDRYESCAQRCVNTVGSYTCGCEEGYTLRKDGTSCAPINDPPERAVSLVGVSERAVCVTSLSSPPAPRCRPALNVKAIDFIYSNRTVCYIHHNVSKSVLVCVSDTFDRVRVLPTPSLFPDITTVTHLRIDWISGNWYFSDSGREVIYMCDPGLTHCRVLVDNRLNKVYGFTIDPTHGVMFWSVWGGSAPSVERASLDGSDRTALVHLKLVYPVGVTVEPRVARLYWADSYLETVERATYHGEHRATTHHRYITQKLFSIGVLENKLYLPMWGNQSVWVMSGGKVERVIPMTSRPTGVLIYHRQAQPIVSHGCSVNNGGCAHMCVSLWKEGRPRPHCVCEHGYRLVGLTTCQRVSLPSYLVVSGGTPPLVRGVSVKGAGAGEGDPQCLVTDVARPTALALHHRLQYIYFSDVHRYQIVRIKSDCTGREVYLDSGVDNCEGLAVDWMGNNLYWTDDALGTVNVARLDNSSIRAVLVRESNYNPRSIVLDPRQGVMYWTVWSGRQGGGRVQTSDMSGKHRRDLVKDDLHWPNGLTLDLDENMLYWCDTYYNKIERYDLTTNTRTLIVQHSSATPVEKPYGLSIYGGAVTWSEHGSGRVVRWVDGRGEPMESLPPPLYDLKTYDITMQTGSNGCSVSNGGCSELCLSTGTGVSCACRTGRTLAGDGRTCVDGGRTEVYCNTGQFHCGRGRCINVSLLCDGDADCPDGSDEARCGNVTCGPTQHLCDNTRCVPNSWLCDGHMDCRDGTDESGTWCLAGCGAGGVRCGGEGGAGGCVPATWRCDGEVDCVPPYTTDEDDCPRMECESSSFTCTSGNCIPWEYVCDGHADCNDASDERTCATPVTTTANTVHDPKDKSLCEENEFECNNGECIRVDFHCDNHVDCLDGSDETECPSPSTPSPSPAPSTPSPLSCPAPSLLCDNATRCVPLLQLCDEVTDCEDGSDEADRCGEAMCVWSGCSHICHSSPAGPVCACPAGLYLQGDSLSCGLTHPCQDWGVCSQLCQPQKNSHKCTCYEGYKLAEDGFTCKSTEGRPGLVVFCNRHEVRALDAAGSRALVSSLKNTVALDWLSVDNVTYLYWTDVVDDKIYRGVLADNGNGITVSDITPVISSGLTRAEGLAVDWVSLNVYWVESSLRQVEVADYLGRHRRMLISGDMDSPRGLALDPTQGYLFWTDWGGTGPRIERSSLAGRDRTVIVRVDQITQGGAWPNGISLDYPAHRVYWIDARSDSIHTTLYDGTEYHEVLRDHSALGHPFSLAVFETHVYWTDWRSNSVARANKFKGTDVHVLQTTLTQPFDIKVVHPSRQPRAASNPCGVNNGNCSHLCLIDSPHRRLCACPHIMRIGQDNLTCEAHEKVILVGGWSSIRGVDVEQPRLPIIPPLAPPILNVHTIHTYAPRYRIYWADTTSNELKYSGLTSGPAEVIADVGLLALRGFALDPAAQLVYYATLDITGDSIVVTDLQGQFPSRVFSREQGLVNITSLAVHPARGRLYWSHSPPEGERIESSFCDGTGRTVVLDRNNDTLLGGVQSMVIDLESDRLYWINKLTATIQYLDLNTNNVTMLYVPVGVHPTGLDVYRGRVYWADRDTLYSADKHTGRNLTELFNNTESILSIRVYDAEVQQNISTACVEARREYCSHLCVPRGREPVCMCAIGYQKRNNKCIPIDSILLYSVESGVKGLSLEESGRPLSELKETDVLTDVGHREVLAPIPHFYMVTAMDYVAELEYMYWVEGEESDGSSIWRSTRSGAGRGRVIAGGAGGVGGVAAGGGLYWSDPGAGLLYAATLDGNMTYVVLDTDPHPVTKVLWSPSKGILFMSGGGWIQRSRGDGAGRDLLHNGTIVQDMCLDHQNEWLYWIDGWSVSIWRMRYDGSDRVRVHSGAPLAHPVGIAVHGGKLYWIDTMVHGGSVLTAPVTNVSDANVLRTNLGKLKVLMVWSSKSQKKSPNPCRGGGGCEELCLWGEKGATCVCPHGVTGEDGKSCVPHKSFLMYSRVSRIDSAHLTIPRLNTPYPPIEDKELMRNVIALAYSSTSSTVFYSDIQRGSINSVYFNGTNNTVLLSQTGAVEGMVYSEATGELYWTCVSGPALLAATVAPLAPLAVHRPPVRRHVMKLQPGDRPRAIDIDPCELRLYWTNWNASRPSINRVYITGFQPQTVISTNILMPNGLSLDHLNKHMYWADARLDKIERANYDGTHRHIVISGERCQHPFSVAAGRGEVYWSDWGARGLWGAGGAVVTNLNRPMGVILVDPDLHLCTKHTCRYLNGGCSDICAVSQAGHIMCSCTPGRSLSPDSRTCVADVNVCATLQFTCRDGQCIPEELTCDGVKHCLDGSDEELFYCTSRSCPADTVQCLTGGRCVSVSSQCDGVNDCDDGNDEENCDCANDHFRCSEGTCVSISGRCDGAVQCPDGSDEEGCGGRGGCPEGAAPCRGAGCYTPLQRCDNVTHCTDGTDEEGCLDDSTESWYTSIESNEDVSGGCMESQFTCGRGSAPVLECIPLSWRCDGKTDCNDGSDEGDHCSKVHKCPSDWFRCASGVCVRPSAICDGRPDCPDGGDEKTCPCQTGFFKCLADGMCLDSLLYCDGDKDCADGSDEPLSCVRPGPGPVDGTGRCGVECAGRCVSRDQVCDGRDHCGDQRDEDPHMCASYVRNVHGAVWTVGAAAGCGALWTCGTGTCVDRDVLCDGTDDCGDYTDEKYCNINECLSHNGGCAGSCTDVAVGRSCGCKAGYRLGADGTDCIDVDECMEDDPCHHVCRNTIGSFMCSCHEGYKLMADQSSCAPISKITPSLIFTNRFYIRVSSLVPDSAERSTLVVHNLTNAVALDFLWTERCLFWSDVTRAGSTIKKTCLQDHQTHQLSNYQEQNHYQVVQGATLQNPDGVAVDWIGRNVYWCDKGTDTIEASRTDGRHRRVLVNKDLYEPRALALHPKLG